MIDSTAPVIVQAHQLMHTWDGRALIHQLDLQLPAGITWLGGEEMTGKTTLLRILGGEVVPTQGWVQVQSVRADQQVKAYAQLVFRANPADPSLDQTSPDQWLATLPAAYSRFSLALMADLVQGFGLAPHMEKPFYMLSAGSRRKVCLAAALSSGAALTLIDQPFAALDGPSIRLLSEVLQDFADQTDRCCVIADYQAPPGLPLACAVML